MAIIRRCYSINQSINQSINSFIDKKDNPSDTNASGFYILHHIATDIFHGSGAMHFMARSVSRITRSEHGQEELIN